MSRSQSASDSSIGRAVLSATPRALAIRGATSMGSRIGSSGTKKMPSGKSSDALAASWSDSRVLPVPPGPVSVSSRVVASSPAAASSSRVAPDERRQLGRQVVRPGVERPEGREVGRQAGGDDLDDPHRRAQVLEPVVAEVPQRDAVDRAVDELVPDQAGGEDLATVGQARRSAPPG